VDCRPATDSSINTEEMSLNGRDFALIWVNRMAARSGPFLATFAGPYSDDG
jgi:hypothetical protein